MISHWSCWSKSGLSVTKDVEDESKQSSRAVYPMTVVVEDFWSVELPYIEMCRICKAIVPKTMADASGSSKEEYSASTVV